MNLATFHQGLHCAPLIVAQGKVVDPALLLFNFVNVEAAAIVEPHQMNSVQGALMSGVVDRSPHWRESTLLKLMWQAQ